MKKLKFLLVLAMLLLPVQAFAAGQYGIYVAPKIGMGFQNTDANLFLSHESMPAMLGIGEYQLGSESFNKTAFTGALAVGYDFNKKFSFPLRAELEYALYGNTSNDYNFVTDLDFLGYDSYLLESYTGSLGVQTLMVNLYYDFHNSTKFVPYVTAGAGIGFTKMKANGLLGVYSNETGALELGGVSNLGSNTKTGFAWSIGLGSSYTFTDNVSLDLGYRYVQVGSGKSQTQYDVLPGTGFNMHSTMDRVSIHQVMLGVRFTF